MDAIQAYRQQREQRQREEEAMFEAIRKHGMPQLVRTEEIERDEELGDSGITKYIVAAPICISRDILNTWAKHTYNSHCQHSYDCCGRIYGSISTHKTHLIRKTDESPRRNIWTLEFSWHQNI